jgi:phosphatidylserine decarboxylase
MLLADAINTEGGFTAFLADKLNTQLKKIFGEWAVFLSSQESAHVLTEDEDGWFSPPGIAALKKGFEPMSFDQVFKCDPSARYWGFKSWDDFFTRGFNTGIREVEGPSQANVISAACESTFYRLTQGAHETDQFWIKGQPYSLRHMLNNDEDYAEQLYGGTVFQGFLAVTSYHRWHSPVTGTIKKIVPVPGTYYVRSPAHPYPKSLGFLTSIAARMLIFIESSNEKIGLMCFVAVGMVEVSTCEATVRVGQVVNRGDQLGMFHFGGSTHCLVFRRSVDIKWYDEIVKVEGARVKVRGLIGAVQE